MTAEQFAWWLKGYLDSLSEPAGLSVVDVAAISKALGSVGKPALPPPVPAPSPQLPPPLNVAELLKKSVFPPPQRSPLDPRRYYCIHCQTHHNGFGDAICRAPTL